MSFHHSRTIHFQDTDAAGVVYFANVLAMCHEAYEASLANTGFNLREFFTHSAFALPIVHARVDFLCPMFCGLEYEIQVKPAYLNPRKFEISYSILLLKEPENPISQATTVHVCIDPVTRTRLDLPTEIMQWLQAA
ncbi:MAG: acyl-CoA thioesterase [Timaviella obliquedivisa GSE-PSE-MK23-08B]|jgi:1,4-dihydroxy-2-naphthoyl-CoA hydrolase|nr:acyl-CoA thioesterase [Timaviella obliquedivisa GSE-PSE-MK23-08B]